MSGDSDSDRSGQAVMTWSQEHGPDTQQSTVNGEVCLRNRELKRSPGSVPVGCAPVFLSCATETAPVPG